jgi:hypothetical protein
MERIMTIPGTSLFSSLRRNHGLEHATLNILAQRFPRRGMAGISFPGGFLIFGNLPTADLREAVMQAHMRLTNGESRLAIHEHCGTNYVASGLVAGVLAWLGMARASGKRDRWERLPLVITLATLGFIASQPLGPVIQKHLTTSGDPQGMIIQDIHALQFGQVSLHRVVTRG